MDQIELQKQEHIEQLRQSIMRLPEFDSWLKHIREQRRAASAQVTANEANATMAEYVEFIEQEYHASRPQGPVVCEACDGDGEFGPEMCRVCGGTGTI